MNDYSSLKMLYKKLERNVLILIILPLPFFAFVYLNVTKPIRTIQLPELPRFLDPLLLALAVALLAFQQINFQRSIKNLKENDLGLEEKVKEYSKATHIRYIILAGIGFLSAFGLLFYENAGFTIAYAIVLVLVSVYKPSPVRIIQLFRLNSEEKEILYHINKE